MRHVRAYLLRLANMFRKKHRRMLCVRKFGCPKIRILATRKSRISMIGFFAKAHRCPAQALQPWLQTVRQATWSPPEYRSRLASIV
jgi:hypothetical protein